jgi:hypothetical protein
MPSSHMMSNSHSVKGGAILFLTTGLGDGTNLSHWQAIYRIDLPTGTTWRGTGIVGEKNEETETITLREPATGARLFWRIGVDAVP